MKKLFLDIGNSRIKWSQSIDGNYEYLGGESVVDFIDKMEQTFFADFEKPDAVYYSSVADAKKVDQIKTAIQQHWQLIPIPLTSQQSCCGIECGYEDFHLLGDDRWMAMQGAASHTKDPFIVIDFGTAVTVDAVLQGKHLGGFIVPGITSLREALAKDTADLHLVVEPSKEVSDKDFSDTLLAGNTESAILGGTLYMCASFINHLIADLNTHLSTQFKVFLTGGDAKQFQALIDVPTEWEEDLVLQGMLRIVESVKENKY